ncbi:hypothetical protein M0R19_08820 [Candidatus Pacearchaeota archaeon]|nr:hypothetical protein [Candidatus Pacearchaeota archaeon]
MIELGGPLILLMGIILMIISICIFAAGLLFSPETSKKIPEGHYMAPLEREIEIPPPKPLTEGSRRTLNKIEILPPRPNDIPGPPRSADEDLIQSQIERNKAEAEMFKEQAEYWKRRVEKEEHAKETRKIVDKMIMMGH